METEPHSSPSKAPSPLLLFRYWTNDYLVTIADTVGLEEKNGSIDFISQNMREMVKKIQDLRHLGIENHSLPLPKIVVVGDQSVGKSSLIEGMSEIKVPRSGGCCTRCPLEITCLRVTALGRADCF